MSLTALVKQMQTKVILCYCIFHLQIVKRNVLDADPDLPRPVVIWPKDPNTKLLFSDPDLGPTFFDPKHRNVFR